MRNPPAPFLISGFLLLLFLLVQCPTAWAIKTAASFDLSWANANIGLDAYDMSTGNISKSRTLSSMTGYQIDYNVALFDYRTVASLSFAQFLTSNLGSTPFNRIALGASYHLVRINGQRMILDNNVESKAWGISPAIEMSIGINKLSIKDPQDPNFDFSASVVDFIPRILVEIPASSNFLIMLRAGYYTTLTATRNQFYDIKAHGLIFNLGVKLSTL